MLVQEINNWTTQGANKHKKLVQKLCEKVFKKKAHEDQKDVMCQGLPYKGHDHRGVIEQLFEIHENVSNLAEGGRGFDNEDFYRNIVVKMLKPKGRVEYVQRGGKNLRDENDVLDLLEEIQEGVQLEIEVNTNQKRRCGK